MRLSDLYAYSDRCRSLLHEWLRPRPELFDRRFETTSRYDTVRLLLAHSVGAEERWIAKRVGGQAVEDYEDRAAPNVDGLFEHAAAVRRETYTFMDGLDESGMQRIIHVALGSPAAGWEWSGDLTIEQILFHIVNHEVHHRAQISMALQQFGADPPNFDYVFLCGSQTR